MRKEHVKPSVVPVLCTVVFCFLLTGCGWMRGSGGCDKNKGYLDSREEPTLGVPPDLTEPDYGLGVNIPETREPSETVVRLYSGRISGSLPRPCQALPRVR